MSAALISLVLLTTPLDDAVGEVEHVHMLTQALLMYDPDLPQTLSRDGYTLHDDGQVAQVTVDLPPSPANHRDTRQIIATVEVSPSLIEDEDGYRAGDPWPRTGNVTVLIPDARGELIEVEIMRFITGFGGTATYTEDVTALAPFLHGRQTLRVFINTYKNPAWEVSLTLSYAKNSAGFRRPALALPVFHQPEVTAEHNMLRATVNIPEGLHRPRMRILSTGHATDGRGGDEFVPRTHVLRIDGVEVARWKPWAERGNTLRHLNPTSGRAEIDGREIWSSDFDRAGWHPGMLVQPLLIPASELTPGEHEIELEIMGIRPVDPQDEEQAHGYWHVSLIVVADEPWPGRAGLRRGGREGE